MRAMILVLLAIVMLSGSAIADDLLTHKYPGTTTLENNQIVQETVDEFIIDWNDTHLVTQFTIPADSYYNIVFEGSQGKQSRIDWSSGVLKYSGDMPIDEAARMFFEHMVGKHATLEALAESGAICERYGHQWYRMGTITMQACLDNDGQYTACPQTERRKCRVCGKQQTKQPETWVE